MHIYIFIYIISIFVCMYRYIFLASSARVVTLEKFSISYVEVLLCFVFVVFEKSFTCAQRAHGAAYDSLSACHKLFSAQHCNTLQHV